MQIIKTIKSFRLQPNLPNTFVCSFVSWLMLLFVVVVVVIVVAVATIGSISLGNT